MFYSSYVLGGTLTEATNMTHGKSAVRQLPAMVGVISVAFFYFRRVFMKKLVDAMRVYIKRIVMWLYCRELISARVVTKLFFIINLRLA